MILGEAMRYQIGRHQLVVQDATGVTIDRLDFTTTDAVKKLMFALGDVIEETLHYEDSKDAA